MIRVAIFVITALAYLVWVAAYLLPHAREVAVSDATLRRLVHTAFFH